MENKEYEKLIQELNWYLKDEDHFKTMVRNDFIGIHKPYEDNQTFEDKINRTTPKLNKLEVVDSSPKTYLKLEDVNYYINDYGCRGHWDLSEKKDDEIIMGVFGCSFTFGEALDDSMIWPNLVKTHLSKRNIRIINMGFPGASPYTCVRYFMYLSSVIDLDYAMFVFPTHFRSEYVFFDKKGVSRYPLIANYNPRNDDNDSKVDVWRKYYDVIDENNMIHFLYYIITIIKERTESKGIKLFASSWDYQTYSVIKSILNENQTLPYFDFLENKSRPLRGLARDGRHPGPATHKNFAHQVVETLCEFSDDFGGFNNRLI